MRLGSRLHCSGCPGLRPRRDEPARHLCRRRRGLPQGPDAHRLYLEPSNLRGRHHGVSVPDRQLHRGHYVVQLDDDRLDLRARCPFGLRHLSLGRRPDVWRSPELHRGGADFGVQLQRGSPLHRWGRRVLQREQHRNCGVRERRGRLPRLGRGDALRCSEGLQRSSGFELFLPGARRPADHRRRLQHCRGHRV